MDARELLVIRWSPVELFKLQEASAVNGPWADVLVEPGIAEEDGVKVAYAEIPPSPRAERFFRAVIDWDGILSRSK